MVGKSLIGQGCPELNGGKASDWLRLCHMTRGQCLIKRAVFDYATLTTQLILELSTETRSMALLSLKVQRETNSCSSREREAVLLLHNTLPRSLKCPHFINNNKTITIITC